MKNRIKKYSTIAALAFAVSILTGCGGGGTSASTADTTAPTTTAAPSVSGTTDTATVLSVTVNENGTGYYLVQPAAASAPTVTDVQAGTSFALTANVPATPAISGLIFNTAYTIYFVAKDTSNNVQAAVQNVSVTTLLIAGIVVQGGLTWTPNNIGQGATYATTYPTDHFFTWTEADVYCTNSTINGATDWRLPTQFELSTLYGSGALNGQGWALYYTWSSTQDIAGPHYNVSLGSGGVRLVNDTDALDVSCVR